MLRQVGNEHIMVDPGQDMVDLSKVYTLNDTAAFLWEELNDQDFTLETMVALLSDHYDVHPSVAESDARKLIQDFKSQGLLID